ncbi:hypothetical protein DBR06_SOUSAS7710087, partial [Sousa chinensis]
ASMYTRCCTLNSEYVEPTFLSVVRNGN